MLILSRKPQEVIVIGENIRIRILDMRNGRVRLGIDAPRDVNIYREECGEERKIVEERE